LFPRPVQIVCGRLRQIPRFWTVQGRKSYTPRGFMLTLYIATRNNHKAVEIRAILGTSTRCLNLRDLESPPELVEDAATFAGNATRKATQLARWLGATEKELAVPPPSFVLADDSGLEVDALRGAPGVYSARFAALDSGQPGNSPDSENSAKLLRLLRDVPADRRTARFRCVLALTPITKAETSNASPVCYADEFELQTELLDGVCEGRIGFAPSGKGGFGYDPLFIPTGFDQTFAELGEDVKNRFSHRAMALGKLKRWLADRNI
jgi:XTP/dITP diphosphohydrolase